MELTKQIVNEAGQIITYSDADVAGDSFVYDSNAVVLIDNTGASTVIVTIANQEANPLSCAGKGLVTKSDTTLSVAAGFKGTFAYLPNPYKDTGGSVQITYDQVTDVKVAVITK